MSTLSFALRDSATMLRRDVRHSLRNLSMTLSGLLVPIIMLVLFVYVFGGAIGAGLGLDARQLHQLYRARDHHHDRGQRVRDDRDEPRAWT